MSVPIFLEIKNYEDVLDALDVIKTRLVQAKHLLQELHSLRDEENQEVHRAQQYIKEMEESLIRINEEVFTT